MDDLLKRRMRPTEDAIKKKGKQDKRKRMVSYSMDGRQIKEKLSKGKRRAIVAACVVSALILAVYVPPMFYSDTEGNTTFPITPDSGAIKDCQAYLKDNPDADFDGDGLNNALEDEHGTSPWKEDSDSDGVSDYAELYSTDTSPTAFSSALVKAVQAEDSADGNTISTPYKVDDIILWPDDYTSKAYGTVVRTLRGYRFCNYSGWVKFPQTVYAYAYRDGIHYELEHKENEDAWRVESSDEILLYGSPLTFEHCLTLPLAGSFYLEDNWFGQMMSALLPDEGGIITCYKASTKDFAEEENTYVTATLRSPMINRDDMSRFGTNMNTLEDLSWVRKLIEAGECVAVSLYSDSVGETVGIVYGYTGTGDLLVADESLNHAGILHITEYARNILWQDGEITQKSYFAFQGLGFDSSKYGNRISFFASTLTDPSDGLDTAAPSAQGTATEETEAQTEEMTETEKETEAVTEPVTEAPVETETEAPAQNVVTFGF